MSVKEQVLAAVKESGAQSKEAIASAIFEKTGLAPVVSEDENGIVVHVEGEEIAIEQ